MAKSIRSKTKRAFRRVKRESGVFAAADAARMHRLSARLKAKLGVDKDGDVTLTQLVDEAAEGKETEEVTMAENRGEASAGADEGDASTPQKVSTSGRRLSRRDAWRLSKGKPLNTKNADKLNRLGGVAAKRRAGRSKRRR
ncbi:hypothetical protein JB92DRAFT_2879122 [Gautieria morchelliformis]|nr:hypothetical protein JB92DRAFT_2879122 [Gautieria morchelliformis]